MEMFLWCCLIVGYHDYKHYASLAVLLRILIATKKVSNQDYSMVVFGV